eukprot:4213357-Amphidinium_carterae.1
MPKEPQVIALWQLYLTSSLRGGRDPGDLSQGIGLRRYDSARVNGMCFRRAYMSVLRCCRSVSLQLLLTATIGLFAQPTSV